MSYELAPFPLAGPATMLVVSKTSHTADPTLIGRYEVRHKLGEGAMGVVYAAHDPELQRDVAVKLLRRDRFEGWRLERGGERLRHEARITARLAHPNVVTIYDVGRHGGSVYIAMELVDGPSMRRWMRDVARPWREVLAMFFQAGMGLAAAHEAGLVHRDFKPGNVLVGDRRARVVDFGLAQVGAARASTRPRGASPVDNTAPSESSATTPAVAIVDALGLVTEEDSSIVRTSSGATLTTTQSFQQISSDVELTVSGDDDPVSITGETTTGLFAGTPAYMAPESFSGGPIDARTDQFAFCVSLWEGLYGERPFAGDTAVAIGVQVLEGRICPPPSRARVPGWLRDIIIKGLAVDPAERHASVRSMLASIAFISRIMWD